MNKPIHYVGIDVGQDELWVAVADRRSKPFAHTAVGIRALVHFAQQAMPDHVLHFCLEATGVYGRSLAVCLLEGWSDDVEVSIVNPAQIAAFGRAQLRRTKTDAVDAQVILAFAQSQHPLPWTPEPPALRELHQLVAEADALRATRGQWSNRAQTHARTPDRPVAVRNIDRAVLRALDRQIVRIEDAITTLCHNTPHLNQQIGLLCSIPGVGRKSAIRFIAYGRRTLTTHSARELTAHAGLAPRHRLSGTSVRGKSHLAKQGDAQLRRSLYMPALVATRYNPILRIVYQRLRENGKPAKLAIAACMRRLLLMARAILKNQQPFDPNYERT
jgi:transposase